MQEETPCILRARMTHGVWINYMHVVLGIYMIYASITISQGHQYIANTVLLTFISILLILVHLRSILHLSSSWRLHVIHILLGAFIMICAYASGTFGKVMGYLLFIVGALMLLYHLRILYVRVVSTQEKTSAAPPSVASPRPPASPPVDAPTPTSPPVPTPPASPPVPTPPA